MQIEIDTTPVHTLPLGEIRDGLKKAIAQIAAYEAYMAELGAAAECAKVAAANAGATYKQKRSIDHMLDAQLRADIAADALETVTNAESTLLALRKRQREFERAIHLRENTGRDYNPQLFMSDE